MSATVRDPDFQEVWNGIVESLGRFAKLAYAVDQFASDDLVAHWKERGIHLSKTSDLLFIRALRKRLEDENLIARQDFLRFLHSERMRIARIHVNLSQHSAGGFISAMYQDGLLHGLEDALTSTSLGTKKRDSFEGDLIQSDRTLDKALQKRDLVEIAYWSGRKEALKNFRSMEKSSIPAYFHPYKLQPVAKFVKGESL